MACGLMEYFKRKVIKKRYTKDTKNNEIIIKKKLRNLKKTLIKIDIKIKNFK